MTQQKITKKLKLPYVFILMLIVFFSCALLIFVNFYTIKILSANRAYVNGESHYSKGQKDAVRHLITYIYTQEEKELQLFKKELKVPQGDGIARIALSHNGDDEVIKNGFRAGRINEKDLDDMIWLFKHFKSVSFLANAIKEWEEGDYLIHQMALVGHEVAHEINVSKLNLEEKQFLLQRISSISDKLTINEREFSNTLGEGCRKIKDYLILTNIFFVLIIIGSVSTYYSKMVGKLLNSKKEIEGKNEDLTLANKELDKFVYSASHDLRSPITSLKGLIEIAQLEDDISQIKDYLNLMYKSLTKQDQFISDIIDYSKNKRKQVVIEPVNLTDLIEDAITQHEHIKSVKKITIKRELEISNIHSDNLRLKIIFNNLLSNAIKYSDENKEDMHISIKTYSADKFHKIEITDNGIGIKKEFQSQIFDMFFVTNNNNKGSGLGLYIVKEAVENINGIITVHSESNIGSKFTVTLPKLYET